MDASQSESEHQDAWISRNRWRLGFALAAVVGGSYFWHRDRRRRIAVERVSERWLAEREFEAGQHQSE